MEGRPPKGSGFSWNDLMSVIHPPSNYNCDGAGADADAVGDQERVRGNSNDTDSDSELKGAFNNIYNNNSSNDIYNNKKNNNNSSSSRISASSSSRSSSSHCDSLHTRFRSDCHWWSWSILCPSQLGTSSFILLFCIVSTYILVLSNTSLFCVNLLARFFRILFCF